MSIGATTVTALNGPFAPASYDIRLITPAKTGSRIGFLRFAWLAMMLSVVAIAEPSAGDIGIALLLLIGFSFGKLSWTNISALPVALIALFVFANLASLCYAIDPLYGASYGLITLFMISLWLFIVGLLTRFGERGLLIVMSGFTAGGLISAGMALLAYVGILSKLTSPIAFLIRVPLDDTLLFYGERLRGFFKDPNVFGPYMVVIAAYAFCRLQARQTTTLRKVFWIFSCILASLSVLLSFSRGAWANGVVTLVVIALLNTLSSHRSKSSRRGFITFLIVGAVVSAAVGYALMNQRVSDVAVYRAEIQTYDEDRFIKHAEAFEIGLSNPLGIGPGQSHLALGYNPHSLPLALFAENGIIGVLTMLGFVFATVIRSLVLSQRATNLFQRSIFTFVTGSILGILVGCLVIDPIHWRHFWFLLALGWMPLWAPAVLNPGDMNSSRSLASRIEASA